MEGASVSVVELGLSGTTGADGVYDFGEVAPGTYTASGQKDTYSPSGGSSSSPTSQSLPAPAGTSTQFELVLDPGARISVHVQQTDGTPVQGVTVSVDGKGWSGVTDASGNFDFGAVSPGNYTISGQKNCFTSNSASQTLNAPPNASTQYQLTLDPIAITSVTVATSPTDRARLRIGVGERVDVTANPAPGSWSVTAGATLSANSGATVRLTAGDRAATVTVTANGPGTGSCSIQFTVVEPSALIAEQVPGTNVWHIQGTPSVGFRANWYVQPADVSFEGITIREKHCAAICTGYFGPQNGQDHVPGADVTLGPVVAGKGSPIRGTDTIQGGDGNIGPPYSNGTFTWPIPWEYQVGSGTPKVFTTMNHVKSIDATGTLTISKGGVTVSKGLNEPNSSY